jgi:arsenite methyltransferase
VTWAAIETEVARCLGKVSGFLHGFFCSGDDELHSLSEEIGCGSPRGSRTAYLDRVSWSVWDSYSGLPAVTPATLPNWTEPLGYARLQEEVADVLANQTRSSSPKLDGMAAVSKESVMESSLSLPRRRQLAERRGDYGFDEPIWPLLLALLGFICLALGWLSFTAFHLPVLGWLSCVLGAWLLFCAGTYLYTTRWGKFQVWADLLLQLGVHGDEQIIDLGCGRGAVLLMAAKLLPKGKATGVDVWRANEQSGNALSVTQGNAELEGVADRVELYTADMRQLPFPDGYFDVVVSSVAIHNIRSAAGCRQAITEAVRVLKPGGRLMIADVNYIRLYRERLQELGVTLDADRSLGWRFWYGGPWTATRLVSARKPGS